MRPAVVTAAVLAVLALPAPAQAHRPACTVVQRRHPRIIRCLHDTVLPRHGQPTTINPTTTTPTTTSTPSPSPSPSPTESLTWETSSGGEPVPVCTPSLEAAGTDCEARGSARRAARQLRSGGRVRAAAWKPSIRAESPRLRPR